MTDQHELKRLIDRARGAGANVGMTYDRDATEREGRHVIQTVIVQGLPGIGPHQMTAIAAAERLRGFFIAGAAMSEPDASDLNRCSTCGEPNNNGEGYDGLCGNCADRAARIEDQEDGDAPTDDALRQLARDGYCASDEVSVDADAKVSRGDDGAWVAAWVWVRNPE